jgi:hypothetical protein
LRVIVPGLREIVLGHATTISTHETLDADHGRIETRNYTVIHDVGWLQARQQWPGLEAVVVVESQREINGKITNETFRPPGPVNGSPSSASVVGHHFDFFLLFFFFDGSIIRCAFSAW